MLVTIPKIAFSLKNQMHLRKARFITALSLHTGVSCKTPSTPACLLSAWEAGWCGRYCQSDSTVPPGLPSARLKGLWPWRVFFWNRTRGDYMGRMHGKHAPGGLPCNSSHHADEVFGQQGISGIILRRILEEKRRNYGIVPGKRPHTGIEIISIFAPGKTGIGNRKDQ